MVDFIISKLKFGHGYEVVEDQRTRNLLYDSVSVTRFETAFLNCSYIKDVVTFFHPL